MMRLQRSGVIVNIGSVSATFTRPFAGASAAAEEMVLLISVNRDPKKSMFRANPNGARTPKSQ